MATSPASAAVTVTSPEPFLAIVSQTADRVPPCSVSHRSHSSTSAQRMVSMSSAGSAFRGPGVLAMRPR